MRKWFLTTLLLLNVIITIAQVNTLVSFEYWFDNNAASKIVLPISNGVESITINEEIDASNLTDGLHTLNYRCKDEKGLWSSTSSHFFIKATPKADANLTVYEYWFDSNSAQKTTKSIESSGVVTINDAIDVNVLPDGLHSINLRCKDSNGQWSSTITQFFIKQEQRNDNSHIVGYRYWFNNAFDKHKSITVEPVDTLILSNINLQVEPNIKPTPNDYFFEPNPLENYHKVNYRSKELFNIQFKDEAGVWSSVKADSIINQSPVFVKCDTLQSKISVTKSLPQCDTINFYMVNALAGDSLVFQTTTPLIIDLYDSYGKKLKTITALESIAGQGVHAKLDGVFYALVHGFGAEIGNYNITYTRIAKYTILGYTPKKVGNKGISILEFEGNGFTSSTRVSLSQDGIELIQPDTILCEGLSKLKGAFNFDNATIGCYDINVYFEDTTVLIKNGLEVELSQPVELSVSIIGPSVFRSGAPVTYTVSVRNNGNVTAYNVPLTLSIKCLDSDNLPSIRIDSKISRLMDNQDSTSNMDLFRLLKKSGVIDNNMFLIVYKEDGSCYLVGEFFIPVLYSKTNEDFVFTISNYTQSISVYADIPKYWDFFQIIGSVKDYEKSNPLGCCLLHAVECYTSMVAALFDLPSSITDCVKSELVNFLKGEVYSQLFCDGKKITNWSHQPRSFLIDIKDQVIKCLYKKFGVAVAETIIKQLFGKTVAGIIIKVYEVTEGCKDFYSDGFGSKCGGGGQSDGLTSNPIRSYDPNDKIGFRSPSGSKYFNASKNNFTYVVNFENKSTATAPAQEVYITDTLDMNIFDINSFRSVYIKIGNKIAQAPFDAQSTSWLVDMRPELNLRTEVKLTLDKQKGIAHWYFKAIDPMTDTLPSDPLVGFLPPNDSIGSGQGCVTFSIDLKDGVEDGESVKNKASIVFDYNDPIITPTWENTKDNIAPISTMFQPVITTDSTALISWIAEDNKNGSGVYRYDLYMKQGSAPYEPLVANTDLTSFDFKYRMGVEYAFYTIAVDSAGNKEVKTAVPDVVLYKSTGIESDQLIEDNVMTVFPNPSNKGVEITVVVNLTYDILKECQLSVTSINGSVIKTFNGLDSKLTVSNLDKGVYLFNLVRNGKTFCVKKVVVQ